MKTAVITGCLGGIGLATCQYFHDKEWQVIGVDKRPHTESPAENFPPYITEYYQCDLSNELDLQRQFKKISERHQGIDALINNAAIESQNNLMQSSNEEWNFVMNTNLRAPYLATRSLHENLRYARGTVINVSSVVARQTSRDSGAYSTSKGALVSLTRALALELAPEGIRVNAILPGAIQTEMLLKRLKDENPGMEDKELLNEIAQRIPLSRTGTPSDVAALVYFLSNNESSSFITGQEFIIDGGVSAVLSSVRWEKK